VEMYGMTETATAFTCGDAAEPFDLRSRTNGTPLPGNEVRVVDLDTGRTLPRGVEGELWVRGPRLFSGYTDGSHEALTSEDGFFRTGDVGLLDEAGHVHYAGRTKTLIKVKGLTVQPEEVEAVIASLAGVRRGVAFGLGDGDESTGLGALVTVEPGATLDAQAVAEHCRAHLSAYKVPVVKVVDEADFPLTANLKPDRVAARRLLADR
jgi:fatty-acyl-CoA synthase